MTPKPILSRRSFAATAFAAAGAGAATALRVFGATPLEPLTPGIKIALQLGQQFTDTDLAFARQIGVEYLAVNTNDGAYETFLDIRRRAEAAGLKISNIGRNRVHLMSEVTLNLPGRDAKIEEYKQYLRDLGRAGVRYTTYAHMANGVWSSPNETARGGASARSFHLDTATGWWNGVTFRGPLTNGRRYTENELWDNYTYFIRQVAPVAEEAGVRIGIHPDDPPIPDLGGVPRCIFASWDGYARALQIANSPNVGVCLCCGTWMEGGDHMGRNVFDAVRGFAKMGKLWKIHFRNVTRPGNDFVETFVDEGYTDMKKLMRTLVEVDFRGILIADHVPAMVEPRAGWAYSIGYIKALYDSARNP